MSVPAGGAASWGWSPGAAGWRPPPGWVPPPPPHPAVGGWMHGGGGGAAPAPIPAPTPPNVRRGGALRIRDYAVTHVVHAVPPVGAFRVAFVVRRIQATPPVASLRESTKLAPPQCFTRPSKVAESGANFQLTHSEALMWREQCPYGPHAAPRAGGGPAAPRGAPPPPPPPARDAPPAGGSASDADAMRRMPGAVYAVGALPPPPPPHYHGVFTHTAGGPPPGPPPGPPLGNSMPQLPVQQAGARDMGGIPQYGFVRGVWYAAASATMPVTKVTVCDPPAYVWETSEGSGRSEFGLTLDGSILRDGRRLSSALVDFTNRRVTLYWEDGVVWASTPERLASSFAQVAQIAAPRQGEGAGPAQVGGELITARDSSVSTVVCPLLAVAAGYSPRSDTNADDVPQATPGFLKERLENEEVWSKLGGMRATALA
eukprot:gene19429-biopygen43760